MKHIYEEYQDIAREYAGAPCLKTDCWNEAETIHPIAPLLPGVVCVEIDPLRVARALVKFPDIDFRQGRVESLPFADGSFARVFDFSTIDHVVDYRVPLNEYRRVLAPDGLLILIAWLTVQGFHWSDHVWGRQLYFPGDAFTHEVAARFRIVKERDFEQLHGLDYLHLFVCRGNT